MEEAGNTIDAFHRGGFSLVQPPRGHRAGADTLILAAAIPGDFSGRLADLGAGAGGVGLAVAARCANASVTLIENSPDMIALARRTLGLPQNGHLVARLSILAADVKLTGANRVAAGLRDASFDFAVMNPPFNMPADRATPDALRRQAHVMQADTLERWLRTAAAITRPGGGLALIARPQSLNAILRACEGRFGAVRVVPVHAHAGRPAIRVVIRACRATRTAMSIEPALVLHDGPDGPFTARTEAINNGETGLFGD